MLRDYEKREDEIDNIDHIIAAALNKGSKYFQSWEEEQYIMQWLYNQRQGVVLEPLTEEDATLLMYIIADGCEECFLYETMKWFVNHVDLERSK